MTTPGKKTKARPGSPSNDRLISGDLLPEKAFKAYLENFKLRRRKPKQKSKKNSQKNSQKNNKGNAKRNYNSGISIQAIHGFNAVPFSRAKIGNKKLKMEGGGDGAFDMPLDEETGSGTGNMQKSLKSQGSRNQLGGFATSFIPAPGVPDSDVAKMKFLGDTSVQGGADSEMDGNVKNLEKPCNRGGGKSRSKKKRRRKSRKRTKKRKRKRKTKRRGGRRSRRRRRRSRRPQLRFSKMPPLYL